MRRTPWLAYLWPGLPQVWVDGAWSGLALASGAAALFNVLLLATFLWVRLLEGRLVAAGWLVIAVLWVGCAASSIHGRRSSRSSRSVRGMQDLFREAQSEYLKGNWFVAETILARLIDHNPRDIEARLMRASLFRHTQRMQEARDELTRLERLEGSQNWTLEIASERERLARQSIAADNAENSVPEPAVNRQAA